MLYLEIDQHARQITVSPRDENGDVLQARQVSTLVGLENSIRSVNADFRRGEID